jgi:hypothetical protein
MSAAASSLHCEKQGKATLGQQQIAATTNKDVNIKKLKIQVTNVITHLFIGGITQCGLHSL